MHECGGGEAEDSAEAGSQADSQLSVEPDAGLDLTTARSLSVLKGQQIKSRKLN